MPGTQSRSAQVRMISSLTMLLAAAIAAIAAPVVAQETTASVAANDDIVITARRSGAPMWTIKTDVGVVILVGEIAEGPK